jgi:hypothetical protein
VAHRRRLVAADFARITGEAEHVVAARFGLGRVANDEGGRYASTSRLTAPTGG